MEEKSEFDRHLDIIVANLEYGLSQFAARGELSHARAMGDALILIRALQAKIPKAD